MKKVFTFFLSMCILVVALASCGNGSSGSEITSYRDEDGNYVYESSGRHTVMVDQLPHNIPYNGNNFSLEDISFYELCSNYEYCLFIVITLDVSGLSDADIHWLRESDLSVTAYITSEANDVDFDPASRLGSLLLTDDSKLIYVQTSSFFNENRHSFASSDRSVVISATQEETYEYRNSKGEISDRNKVEELHFMGNTGESIPDTETIGEPLYSYVAQWLYEEVDSYKRFNDLILG